MLRHSLPAALVCFLLCNHSTLAAAPQTLRIDASKTTGTIRWLQGVNLGPLETQTNLPALSDVYRQLHVDTVRTHDYFGPTDLDAHPKDKGHDLVIFPDWNADPKLETSYRFGPSDRMIQGIVAIGAQPYFRLGRSFAADPTPPPDFDKFAEVARHIVMHYNSGWANGFHDNIKYWEVWNEPNVEKTWVPNKGLYLFWSGTREQFFDLYAKTARALKDLDPTLKVGGPGLAEGARETPWREGFVEYCAKQKVPLDFLSWHHYHTDSSDPWDMVRIGKDVRKILDRNGFKNAESHCNEWNLNLLKSTNGPQHQASMEAAAFTASALMYLQDSKVDLSCFYKGNEGNMGCFDLDGSWRKKAHALQATGMMNETPTRLDVHGGDTYGFAVLAGRSTNSDTVQILVSNYQIAQPKEPPKQSAPPGSHGLERRKVRTEEIPGYLLKVTNLPWGKNSFTVRRYRVDAGHGFEVIENRKASGPEFNLTASLPAPAIELVVLTSTAN